MFGFIGIGVCVVSRIILFGMLMSHAYAANPYKMGEVDYFNNKEGKALQEDFDFREPTMGADGKIAYYTPPSVMLNLLEDPTPEHAKIYLAWQKQRLAKIIKAQQAIDQVIKEDHPI